MLTTFSVLPLETNHFEERCEDILRQHREHIADTPLFMVELRPEGTPAEDLAGNAAPLLCRYRDALAPEGIRPAVLIQSSLGHDYAITEPAPFQRILSATDGTCGDAYCPLDPGIHEYFRRAMTTLAGCGPSAIMLDDDFRLYARQQRGCVCDRHMARFNKTAGTGFSREEWIAYLSDHGETDPLVRLFARVQTDTLKELAREMRRSIDDTDPSVQGIVCTNFMHKETPEIASLFAGAGHPVIARVANGTYAPASLLNFSDTMRRTAVARQVYEGIADVLLAETDCIPYNPYGKSAAYLHAHYLFSCLDGLQGAKHWITRLSEFSPSSGEGYRRILAKNAGLYEKCAALSKDLSWLGCRIPIPERDPRSCGAGHFAACFLERVGIPFYFSGKPGGVVCANGALDTWFSKEELERFFDGSLILSSDAAQNLQENGFGDLLGVSVSALRGEMPDSERFDAEDRCWLPVGVRCLEKTGDGVETLSEICHKKGKEEKALFPGATLYHRGKGKYTAVFAGTPRAQHTYTEAFGFLNAARKRQFAKLLSRMGELPVYCDGPEPVLLRAASLPDGRLLVALLNLGDDALFAPVLAFDRRVKTLVRLNEEGREEPVAFEEKDGKIRPDRVIQHMEVNIFLAICE